MDAIQTIALAKAVDDGTFSQLSKELTEGTYVIDCTVRLRGTVKKGAPYEQTVAAAIDPWSLLYRALSKLNGATIESLVQEALADTDEGKVTVIKDEAKAAVAKLVAKTKRPMAGRITAQVLWEVVS